MTTSKPADLDVFFDRTAPTVQARTQKPRNAFRQPWQQWRQLQAGAIRKQPSPWGPMQPSSSRHLLKLQLSAGRRANTLHAVAHAVVHAVAQAVVMKVVSLATLVGSPEPYWTLGRKL